MLIALHQNRWARRLWPILGLSILLAACSSGVTGESWAGISTSPDGKSVYLAYQEKLFRLDTTNPDPYNRSTIHWGVQIPGSGHSYPPPSLSDSALFVGSYDGHVYSFDQATGKQLWKSADTLPDGTALSADDKIFGGTAYDKTSNLVYSPYGAKGLGAFDPATGKNVAFFDGTTYGIWAAPLVIGDTVYAASLDHYLYALDSKTLVLRWKLDVGGGVGDTPTYDGGHMLYIGTFNSQVLAIDISGTTNNVPTAVSTAISTASAMTAATAVPTSVATAASTAISTPIPTNVATAISAASATSVVTTAAGTATATCTTVATAIASASVKPGKIVNCFTAANWVWGSPVIDQGTLYFGDLNGILYGLDISSFKAIWRAQDTANSGGFRGRVAIVDNPPLANVKRLIIAGNENKRVYGYVADTNPGTNAWNPALLTDRILGNPLIVHVKDQDGKDQGELLFTTMSEDQILIALNLQTGQVQPQWAAGVKLSDLVKIIPTATPSS